MNMSRFQGLQTPSFAMPGLIPDDSETQLSDAQPDANRTDLDDYQTWNWAEAATEVGINESTLRKVWWEKKLEPAFLHCLYPLRVTVRTTPNGRQIAEFSRAGIEVLQAYKAALSVSDRAAEVFLSEARAKFPAPSAEHETAHAPVTVESATGDPAPTPRYQPPGILSNLPASSLPSRYGYQSPDENPLVLALQQQVQLMQQRNEAALNELQDFNCSKIDTQQVIQTFDDLQAVEAGMAEADRYFWLKEQAKKRRLEELEAQGRNLGNAPAPAAPPAG